MGIHNGFYNGKADAAASVLSGSGFINLVKFGPELSYLSFGVKVKK